MTGNMKHQKSFLLVGFTVFVCRYTNLSQCGEIQGSLKSRSCFVQCLGMELVSFAQLQVSCLSQQGCPIWVSLLMRACQDTAGDSGETSCQPANTPAARASPLLSLLRKDSKCPTKLLALHWSNHSAVLEVQVTNADMNWKEKKRLCNN